MKKSIALISALALSLLLLGGCRSKKDQDVTTIPMPTATKATTAPTIRPTEPSVTVESSEWTETTEPSVNEDLPEPATTLTPNPDAKGRMLPGNRG